jgi:hypothetical protein
MRQRPPRGARLKSGNHPSHGPLVSMGKVPPGGSQRRTGPATACTASGLSQLTVTRSASARTPTGKPRKRKRTASASSADGRQGSWNLDSINLARFVAGRHIDRGRLAQTVRLAVRFLHDVIDVSRYPLPELEQAAHATRKAGLGIMGARRAVRRPRRPATATPPFASPAASAGTSATTPAKRPRTWPKPAARSRSSCPAPTPGGGSAPRRTARLASVAPARHGALGIRTDDDKVALEVDPVQRPRGTARPS